jgi:hypothetical protein
LILPTLEALKDKTDVLIIATLVASDGDGLEDRISANARMAKFIPYDLLLPYVSAACWKRHICHSLLSNAQALTAPFQVDILVSNGGYGTVQQALRAGVPMVLAGEGQDKAQTGGIAAWAGVSISFQKRRPRVEKLREAIQEVLDNKKYKNRASALAADFGKYDALKAFDDAIQDAVKSLA